MATLPGLIVNLTLQHAQFVQGINQVNQQLGTLNRTVNIAKNALTGFLAGFGVQQMVALGKGAIDAAGGMEELSQQAGVSAKQLQILQFAGVQVGVSQQQLVTALSQLNVRLSRAEEGTGNLRTMLQRYNIATKDAQGNTRETVDIMKDFADVIQETGDRTERSGISAELFGARIGGKLLPLLSQGSEGIEEFGRQVEAAGLLLGDEFIADADAASDGLATLQLALQRGFQIGVISEFRDSVSSSIDAMIEAKEAGEALGTIVGGALRLLAGAVETLVPLFKQLASEIDTISSAAEKIGNLAERFTGDAVAVELLNGDIGSLNEQIAELIGRRRELESTGVGSERAITEINDQIEVFRRQREELIETRNQLQFVDTAEKKLGDTVADTTTELDKQARVLPGLAAQLQRTHGELIKLAAIDMADLQVELDPIKRDRAEVEFSLQKHKEEGDNIVRITQEWTQRANQVRHQANEEAIRDHEAAVERQAAFDRQKAQETADSIIRISEQTIQRGEQARRQAIEDEARNQERQAEDLAKAQQRMADQAADAQAAPFAHAAEGIQDSFTGAYENIFSGGVDTFTDLAEEIKRVFIRLAAEIATLMTIKPILEPLTGVGAGALSGGLGTGFGGFFGRPLGSQLPASGIGPPTPGFFGSTASLGQLLFAGGLGGLGGSLIGGQFGGHGAIGGGIGGGFGALGGALLGSAFPGVGTLLGGLIGGGIGSLGGGFLGSLFGGGSSGNEVSIGGGFGRAGAGGTGAAAKFVVAFDKQMSEILNDRQRELADQALREAKSVSVKYDKELSEGDKSRLAAGRVAPVAEALGFRRQAFEGLGAEESLGRLQEALQLERTIEDLTGAVTPFKRSILDLRAQFEQAESDAREFGISTTGMGRALREAEKQLREQRNFERSSLRLQLQAIIGTGSGAKELAVAISGIKLQFQGLREQAEALGLSLKLVDQAEAAAIKQAEEAAQQLHEQRQFERDSLRLQLRGMIGTDNASRQLAIAVAVLRLQFEGLKREAEELGVSLKLVEDAERAAVQQLRDSAREAAREAKRQQEADKAAARSFIKDFTSGSDFESKRNAINADFRQALRLADQYNLSERGIREARTEAIRALKRQEAAEKATAQATISSLISGSDFERELNAINNTFREAGELARRYGLSEDGLAEARTEAIRALKRQEAAEKAAAQADISSLISGSDFERDLNAINVAFREAGESARQYGLSEEGLTEARTEAIRTLRLQQQEHIDALALSVIEPFLALSNPLRDFTADLERSLLSPIELYRRAQEDFRETARLAQAGDIDAIKRLREEGQFYIDQASQFGASPAQVQATHEVLRATEGVTTQVDISMREASRGITDEIRRASNREVDTLDKLERKLDEVVREIKKQRS